MPFFELKQLAARQIAAALQHPDITPESIFQEAGTPPNIAMGHLALPCFKLSKTLKKNPHEVAKLLAEKLSGDTLTVSPAGPYANFRWNVRNLYTTTVGRIFKEGARYGADSMGNGKSVIIEYCSPNIAKMLAFHHIRSTLIGNTLANVYDFLGYKTERINFVGDWGTQFARLLAAFELWGDATKLSVKDIAGSMAHLSEIYVRYHKDIEQHPERLEKANQCLMKLEGGDAHATSLWKTVRDVSIAAMETTLKRMAVTFNHVEGESTYVPQIEPVLKEIKAKADAKPSEGAWIVEVEGYTTPALIQKRDGTTLYLTRDIAAAIDRANRFKFEKMFYVVSEQQKLHFQLLFGVLKKMGYAWSDSCEHLSFGTVLFGSEKMSTREGRVVLLSDILDQAKALALVECTQKNPDLVNKEEVAEQVGIGAIVFGELSAHRQRDIEFDFKAILALEGDTGPYVQYAVVRCNSLLDKAEAKGEGAKDIGDVSKYDFAPEEEGLILSLAKFRSTLLQVTRENEPYHLTYYLIDLAKSFNRFYYRFPVLQASDALQRQIRLNLVRATLQTLQNGLALLGIACPKEM